MYCSEYLVVVQYGHQVTQSIPFSQKAQQDGQSEGRSRNHCCGRKASSITYAECVFAALVSHQAMRMRHFVICCLSGSTIIFPNYLINGKIFEKRSY
jgi:hypothetical protein